MHLPKMIPSGSVSSSTLMTGRSGFAGACIFCKISSVRVSATVAHLFYQ